MAKQKKKYTKGKWKDLDNYHCNQCKFSTLDEETMLRHIWEAHEKPPPPQPMSVDMVDRFGNKITEK